MCIDDVISYFVNGNGKLKYIVFDFNVLKETNENLYHYICGLYSDIDINNLTVSELIYRIKNNIVEIPKCPVCGNPIKYDSKYKFKYRTFCSDKCKKSDIGKLFTKNKTISTNIVRYGTECPMQNDSIRKNILIGWEEKYGYNNPNKNVTVKLKQVNTKKTLYGEHLEKVTDKIKITCLKKYGVDNIRKSDFYKDKVKLLMQLKYGVDNYSLTAEYKEKYKKTSLIKYGVDNYSKTDAFIEYMQNRIIPNNFSNEHYRFPKTEQYAYEYLLNYFDKSDIKRLYKSDIYPYYCDLYIESINLYIEIQGHWSHGKQPYNENDAGDYELLLEYKNKANKGKHIYDHVIYIWTVRDVEKRLTAERNNLLYLEIFSYKKNDIISSIDSYLQGIQKAKISFK